MLVKDVLKDLQKEPDLICVYNEDNIDEFSLALPLSEIMKLDAKEVIFRREKAIKFIDGIKLEEEKTSKMDIYLSEEKFKKI